MHNSKEVSAARLSWLVAGVFSVFCRFFFHGLCRLSVAGGAALPSRSFLICANHRSHADSVAILTAIDIPFEACGLLAAEDYFFLHPGRLRIVSSVLRLIPVQRRPTADGFSATMTSCQNFLASGGRAIIAYPEGTRGNGERMSSFKRGPAILALRLGIPVVPAYVSGTERVLPKGGGVPRPAAVEVRFGAAILPSDFSDRHSRIAAADLTREIEMAIRRLADDNKGSLSTSASTAQS